MRPIAGVAKRLLWATTTNFVGAGLDRARRLLVCIATIFLLQMGCGKSEPTDACPQDLNKDEPGQCGCGRPDEDQDGDGFADCVDNCPMIFNDQADDDQDGFGNACDQCPSVNGPSASEADEVCRVTGHDCGTTTEATCGGALFCGSCLPIRCPYDLDTVRRELDDHPPGMGDVQIRRAAIESLDEALIHSFCVDSAEVENFYAQMTERFFRELRDPIPTGARVWITYNHGFVVRTPDAVFAFDLVNGHRRWTHLIPDRVLDHIDVLFVSHRHGDHLDRDVARRLIEKGRQVVVPIEDAHEGTVGMAAGEARTIAGLQVVAHRGLHSVPVRVFEVTTSNGLRIMHTGDNQTSAALPVVPNVDLLLLNAWVNESGSASAAEGMRRSITLLRPQKTIPGHVHELGHTYDPQSPASRVPYAWPLQLTGADTPTELHILAWGEYIDLP